MKSGDSHAASPGKLDKLNYQLVNTLPPGADRGPAGRQRPPRTPARQRRPCAPAGHGPHPPPRNALPPPRPHPRAKRPRRRV